MKTEDPLLPESLSTLSIKPYSGDRILELHNIGSGHAKNVSIKWEYDLEAVWSKIESEYRVSNEGLEKQDIMFLPPNSIIPLIVPFKYFAQFGAVFDVKSQPEAFSTIPKVEYGPELQLTISYSDQFGAVHNCEYDAIVTKFFQVLTVEFKGKQL
jgi:hypothetical protein